MGVCIANFDIRADRYSKNVRNANFYAYWVREVIAACQLFRRQETVLELGCGSGFSTREFLASFDTHDYTGIDPSGAMLRHAAKLGLTGRMRLEQATAEKLPVEDATISLVVSSFAFHWFNIPKALDEIARVLRPDGKALLIVPTFGGKPVRENGNHLLKRIYVRHQRKQRCQRTASIGINIDKLIGEAISCGLETLSTGHLELVEAFESVDEFHEVLDSRGSLQAIFGNDSEEITFDSVTAEDPIYFRWRTGYLLMSPKQNRGSRI